MTWQAARDYLKSVVAAVDGVDAVYRIPPLNLDHPTGVVVMMIPPARTTDRRGGDKKQKSYMVRMTVMHRLGDGNPDVACLLYTSPSPRDS